MTRGNAPSRRRDKARRNGEGLALLMQNDQGIDQWLDRGALEAVIELRDAGLTFGGLQDALLEEGWNLDFDEEAEEYAISYAKSLSPHDAAQAIFAGDFDDAARSLGESLNDKIKWLVGEDPEYWLEVPPPADPGGVWGLDRRYSWWLDHPEAQREYVRSRLARVLQKAGIDPDGPGPNPPRGEDMARRAATRSRRNPRPRPGDRLIAVAVDAGHSPSGNPQRGWIIFNAKGGKWGTYIGFIDEGYDGQAALGDRLPHAVELGAGFELSKTRYRNQLKTGTRDDDLWLQYRMAAEHVPASFGRDDPTENPLTDEQHREGERRASRYSDLYAKGASNAEASGHYETERHFGHNRSLMDGARSAHQSAQDGRTYPAELRDRHELELFDVDTSGSANPPKADGKWHRGTTKTTSRGTVATYTLLPRDGWAWGILIPYRPRSVPASAWAGAKYEADTGQKIPKGTKWVFVARDGSGIRPSAHKDLAAAKKAGAAALGRVSSPGSVPPKGPGRGRRNPGAQQASMIRRWNLVDPPYWKGDRGRWTGEMGEDQGGDWLEIELVEGHRKGDRVWVDPEHSLYQKKEDPRGGFSAFSNEPTPKKNRPAPLLPLAPERKTWNGATARKRLRTLAKKKGGGYDQAILRQAFLVAPSTAGDREDISKWKFPIADVATKGGKRRLVAVPHAIFAAQSALHGGRGGAKLSEGQRRHAQALVNRYYQKINRAYPNPPYRARFKTAKGAIRRAACPKSVKVHRYAPGYVLHREVIADGKGKPAPGKRWVVAKESTGAIVEDHPSREAAERARGGFGK